MPCPFPGMDPYLERSAIWPDFHDSLIAYLREALQPRLRPRYAALTQDRLYVVEHQRPIRPDVSVVRTSMRDGTQAASPTTMEVEPDTPLVFDILEEQVRQPLLHIVEPAAGNRIVTGIEVLSPDNKTTGIGRDAYLQKKGELLQADAHVVEIDLLRGGQRTVPGVDGHPDATLAPDYVVAVTRTRPPRYEFYPFSIRQRLPRIRIPLAASDPDVVLDLQAAFHRCWETGPYPELLVYDEGPPISLSEDDAAWCRRLIETSSDL